MHFSSSFRESYLENASNFKSHPYNLSGLWGTFVPLGSDSCSMKPVCPTNLDFTKLQWSHKFEFKVSQYGALHVFFCLTVFEKKKKVIICGTYAKYFS